VGHAGQGFFHILGCEREFRRPETQHGGMWSRVNTREEERCCNLRVQKRSKRSLIPRKYPSMLPVGVADQSVTVEGSLGLTCDDLVALATASCRIRPQVERWFELSL